MIVNYMIKRYIRISACAYDYFNFVIMIQFKILIIISLQ